MKHFKTLFSLLLVIVVINGIPIYSALPEVTNVSSSQRDGTKLVDILYDVVDADGDVLKVRIEISDDGGVTYQVPAFTFQGDIGDDITPGTGKLITWDAGKDWDGEYSDQMRVKVIASDAKGLPGLAWSNEVPPGGFLMGQDGGAEGSGPSRHVNIPWSYWLSKYEIRVDQYSDYLNIALITGHIERSGTTQVYAVKGKYPSIVLEDCLLLRIGDNYDIRWNVNKFEPVPSMEDKPVGVTWYGAIAFAQHYGYDLPTFAEWEKAARGPDQDDEGEHQVYPWGNEITDGHANFNSYKGGKKSPIGYYDGNQEPFGPDTGNKFGLYDLIGNVSEWVRSKPDDIETYPQIENLSNARHSFPLSITQRYGVKGGNCLSSRYDNYHKLYYQYSADCNSYYKNRGFRVVRRDL